MKLLLIMYSSSSNRAGRRLREQSPIYKEIDIEKLLLSLVPSFTTKTEPISDDSNTDSDLDAEIEHSAKDIEELFKICKKKMFKAGDQFRLLDAPKVKDIYGNNIIQAYMKSKHSTMTLIEKLFKEDHDIHNINKEGDTIVYTCLLYCYSNPSQKYEKINWLLDKGCSINIPKYDITKFFLFDFPRKNHLSYFSSYYFDLLVRIFNMNLLETDLRDKYKYISFGYLCFYCYDCQQIKWFVDNFKFNYEYSVSPDETYNQFCGNPFYYSSIYGIKNRDVLIYLLEKNPLYLIDSVNRYNVLGYTLRYSGSLILHMIEIYAKDKIDKDLEQTSWDNFVERCSSTFYFGLDRYYKKELLIFGLKYRKIKRFPINILKSLRLTLDDFEGDIVNYNTGVEWEDGIHPDLLFPEDYPENKKTIIEVNEQSHDVKQFTKDFCLKEHKKIMDYIQNNKFETEQFPGAPFDLRAERF